MNVLEQLATDLARVGHDWNAVQAVFRSHMQSDFLERHLADALGAIDRDADHVVPGCTGPTTLALLNNAEFEYSLRILKPFASRPHAVKWTGMRQIIGVKGRGSATVRRLKVPQRAEIDSFRSSLRIEEPPRWMELSRDMVASESRHEILDIDAVSETLVAEVLVCKRDRGLLCWTFDAGLDSVYAEESSLEGSRFRNVLDLARAAGRAIPDQVYQAALACGHPQVALTALESMIEYGHAEVFAGLQQAMASPRKDLGDGARRLFDLLFSS